MTFIGTQTIKNKIIIIDLNKYLTFKTIFMFIELFIIRIILILKKNLYKTIHYILSS
jgi:hypothetical protein